MGDLLTEIGNLSFGFFAIIAAWHAYNWYTTKMISEDNKVVVLSFTLMFLAVGVKITFCGVAMLMSDEGEVWSEVFRYWQPFVVLPTAGMFGAGVMVFISHIEGHDLLRSCYLFCAASVLAVVASFIG